jgi:hypothetical protein
MFDLGTIIKYYRYYFYQNIGVDTNGKPSPCSHYVGNDECKRESGCYCKKLAEVRGNIDYVIPQEYRDLTINNASGFINTKENVRKQVWSNANKAQIQTTLRKYLFDGEELHKLMDREACNKASKMDARFANGESVVIHGSVIRNKKDGLPSQPLPSGKTLIACLILKEAMWRRLYKTNRADTYAIVSFQNLKHDFKTKSDRIADLKDTDWLVIDDISLPNNENDFAHQQAISSFDDFLMTRIDNSLPTVLVCDFDAFAKDYTSLIGYSFQKLVTMKNTWHIQVGGDNINE